MTALKIGDRVWWRHTAVHIRHGVVEDIDGTIGVRATDDGKVVYLNPVHIERAL